jgi:hypothetical protein
MKNGRKGTRVVVPILGLLMVLGLEGGEGAEDFAEGIRDDDAVGEALLFG